MLRSLPNQHVKRAGEMTLVTTIRQGSGFMPTTCHCGGLGQVFGWIASDRAGSSARLLKNREFLRSIVGSAALAHRQGIRELFPNRVEGNGVRGHPVLASLGELMQQTLLALLLGLCGLRERRGDP